MTAEKPMLATPGLKFDPHALASEQLQHVYRDRNGGLYTTLLGGLLQAMLIGWGTKLVFGAAWYGWLATASFWHWWIGRPVHARTATPLAGIPLHVAAAAVAGIGWGGAALMLPHMALSAQAAVLVVMVIAVNTALPRLVIFMPLFYAFAAGVFLPVVLVLPFLAPSAQGLTAVVLIASTLMLGLTARNVRAVLVRILLKQVSFEQVSWEDRLTGLGNRRRFDEALDAAWQHALQLGVPLSLMILDVDYFKKFNDTYGHTAGDDCLRKVATALAGCVKRAGDTVARYGGEEFAAVLFHAPMADARQMGENMCNAVRAMDIKHEQSTHQWVTISVGGATIMPKVGMSMQAFVETADAALYRAKESGRNRVEWKMLG